MRQHINQGLHPTFFDSPLKKNKLGCGTLIKISDRPVTSSAFGLESAYTLHKEPTCNIG